MLYGILQSLLHYDHEDVRGYVSDIPPGHLSFTTDFETGREFKNHTMMQHDDHMFGNQQIPN